MSIAGVPADIFPLMPQAIRITKYIPTIRTRRARRARTSQFGDPCHRIVSPGGSGAGRPGIGS